MVWPPDWRDLQSLAHEDVKIRMGFAQVWAVGYVGSRMHGKLKSFKVTSRALPTNFYINTLHAVSVRRTSTRCSRTKL